MAISAAFFRCRALTEPFVNNDLTKSTQIVKTSNIGRGISFHDKACITLQEVINNNINLGSDHTNRGLVRGGNPNVDTILPRQDAFW
jgi:hypothetical protein